MELMVHWVGLIPAFCKCRGEVEGGIAGNETIEDQLIDVLGLAFSAYTGIEVRGAAFDEKDDGVRIAWHGSAAG
jgi:hypothetical protein